MKQSNIKPIILSVIAFLLLIAALSCAVLLIAGRISQSDDPTAPHKQDNQELTEQPPYTADPDSTKETLLSDDGTKESPTGQSITDAPTSETPAAPSCVLLPTPDAGYDYQNSLTFLGDSTTYHMIINGVLQGRQETRQVWHGAGGTLSLQVATVNDLFDGSSETGKPLADLASEKRPQILVITLGVGVSATFSESKFKLAYNAVIDTVLSSSPSTKIICNSIYPVCRSGSSLTQINNPDIVKANKWILECAQDQFDQGKAVYYLDSFSAIADEEGFLPDSLSNGDGLHLTALGYNLILENIRRHKIPD